MNQTLLILKTEHIKKIILIPLNIEQFSKEDREYIIVFFYNNLYFFYPNETLIEKMENISFDNCNLKNPNLVISYGHFENEYYFCIIYLYGSNIIFNKGIFNSATENITFSQNVYEDEIITLKNFSCISIVYSHDNVINLVYGDDNQVTMKSFDLYNNFKVIEELSNYYYDYDNSRAFTYFKPLVLPSKELSIECYFNASNNRSYYLYCGKYNISSNSIFKKADLLFGYIPDYAIY